MAISINEIKYIQSLAQKKYRQKYNKFIVEGDKMAREILNCRQYQIDALYALPTWLETNQNLLSKYSAIFKPVTPKELGRISNLKTPNQVLLIADKFESLLDEALISNKTCLYIDAIRDPGNMGTILRIADWFGIPYVFRSSDTVELFSPKVIQASMGAFLRIKSPEISLEKLSNQFPQISTYGAVMEGKSIFDITLSKNGIIVIGNEGRGISKENLKFIQHAITIPKGKDGGAESLNAAIATGIICATLIRNS